jgi:hypothetical protein
MSSYRGIGRSLKSESRTRQIGVTYAYCQIQRVDFVRTTGAYLSDFLVGTRILIELCRGANIPKWHIKMARPIKMTMVEHHRLTYLFTVGDEEAPHRLTKAQIKQFIGDDIEREMTTQEVLNLAQRTYDVLLVGLPGFDTGSLSCMVYRLASGTGDLRNQHIARYGTEPVCTSCH